MLAEVSFTTEGITVISTLLVMLTGVIGYLFRNWMVEKQERLAEMKIQRDEYKKLLVGDIIDSEKFVHRQMRERNIPLVAAIAGVIPESNSPPTEKQNDAAEFATLKARTEALKVSRNKLINGQEMLADDAIRLGEDAARLSENVKALSREQIAPVPASTDDPSLPSGIVPGNLTAVGIIKTDEGETHPVQIKGTIDPPVKPDETGEK